MSKSKSNTPGKKPSDKRDKASGSDSKKIIRPTVPARVNKEEITTTSTGPRSPTHVGSTEK